MDLDTIGKLWNTYGISGVLVLMLWRGMVYFAPIIKDQIVPMLLEIGRKHIAFLDTTSGVLTHNTEKLDTQSVAASEHTEKLDRHTNVLNAHTDILNDHTDTLKDHGIKIREIHSKVIT